MPKQLTAQTATITTAAVEVKTLTISGKQVTLAVFRQLREEPLVGEDGTLNGVPWGYVNYHPDKCDGSRSHWHIVWQRGDELLRSRVNKVPSFDPELNRRSVEARYWTEEGDLLLTAQVREWLHRRLDERPLVLSDTYSGRYSDGRILGKPFGFEVEATASKTAMDAVSQWQKLNQATRELAEARESMAKPLDVYTNEEWRQKHLERCEESLAKARVDAQEARAKLDAEVNAWGCTFEEFGRIFAEDVRAEAERRQRHRDLRTTLAALPQLFIAV